MWYQAVKELDADNLVVIGVVQEQHAERTRLYKQWKQYDFPIVQDSMTQNGIAVVPVFIGIDEFGVVQSTRMRPAGLKAFVETKAEKPDQEVPRLDAERKHEAFAKAEVSIDNLVQWGDHLLHFLPRKEASYDLAIEAYTKALQQDDLTRSNKGAVLFRLGVAYRKKYDELSHEDEDFDNASKYWSLALSSNPNQYIWRRRIQQYGPRQAKPYPFYDWVDQAIADIRERGDDPVKLTVALTQSELAGKSRPGVATGATNPDPKGEIFPDEGELIRVESTTVPGFVTAGKPATVHLQLVPEEGAKWNNESSPLVVWVESENADLTAQLMEYENPVTADSTENRRFEFDLSVKNDSSECTVTGFALYNVCQEDGTCVYRRQDFKIQIPFESKDK